MDTINNSTVYGFLNKRKHICKFQRLFYIGSTQNTPPQRLRSHIDDCLVNTPDREVYQHIRQNVGMRKWDMVVLRTNIPDTERLLWERIYHDQLMGMGFKLLNCVKPHVGNSSPPCEPIDKTFELNNEAWSTVQTTIDETLDQSSKQFTRHKMQMCTNRIPKEPHLAFRMLVHAGLQVRVNPRIG